MTLTIHAQHKLQKGQTLPPFSAKDAMSGKVITNEHLKGRKVLLSFMRNAGCPICNLHVHQMLQQAGALQHAGIDVLLVYESTQANMQEYLKGESYPFTFIADPNGKMYNAFAIEHSLGKLMKANFHGAMGKMSRGKKLFKEKIKQDGKMTTVGADFLIADGALIDVNYGDYVGDHLHAEQVISKFRSSTPAKDFTATTIEGKRFQLSELKGKKIFLSFFRNGACAVCNLRVHELVQRQREFEMAGIVIVAVFESSIEDMKPYVGQQKVPFTLLSDPEAKLYNLYGVKVSQEAIQQVMTSGSANERVAEAAEAGFQLTKQEKANFYRLPADVLIDENFNIVKIHHCERLIDHLPIDEVLRF